MYVDVVAEWFKAAEDVVISVLQHVPLALIHQTGHMICGVPGNLFRDVLYYVAIESTLLLLRFLMEDVAKDTSVQLEGDLSHQSGGGFEFEDCCRLEADRGHGFGQHTVAVVGVYNNTNVIIG